MAWEIIRNLEEAQKWDLSKLKNILSAYRQYLNEYPQGLEIETAKAAIEKLRLEEKGNKNCLC